MLTDLAPQALSAAEHLTAIALAQPPTGGGPDFSTIAPDSRGVPKTGALVTIGQVMLFFGLGISFLVFVGGLIAWIAGHAVGGMHMSQSAKSTMLRAGFGGLALSAAGGIWTWFTTTV